MRNAEIWTPELANGHVVSYTEHLLEMYLDNKDLTRAQLEFLEPFGFYYY